MKDWEKVVRIVCNHCQQSAAEQTWVKVTVTRFDTAWGCRVKKTYNFCPNCGLSGWGSDSANVHYIQLMSGTEKSIRPELLQKVDKWSRRRIKYYKMKNVSPCLLFWNEIYAVAVLAALCVVVGISGIQAIERDA